MHTPLGAFHSDPQLKATLLTGIARHRAMDLLAAGSYHTDEGEVCAIGCQVGTLREAYPDRYGSLAWGDHLALARALGLPEWILRLEDHFFEQLPLVDRLELPGRLIEAIPVGADLTRVLPAWLARLLTRRINAGQDPEGVVTAVRDLCIKEAGGDVPTKEEWAMVRAAAEAWAAAAEAAEAAWAAEYRHQADDLIACLQEMASI